MKKTIALLLALVMLLALAACDTSENTPSTNDSGSTVPSSSTPASSAPVTSTPASSTPTSSAPTPSNPATSTPTSTPSSQPNHTHTYSSSITTAATCDKPGVKTFTCSCGDTYTERINATGHSWENWKTVKEPTFTEKGQSQRKCAACSATELKDIDKLTLPFQSTFTGGNALAVTCLNSGSGKSVEGMLNFCSYDIFYSYIYEHGLTPLTEKYKITIGQQDFYFTQYAVPEDVVLSIIYDRFILMEDFWYDALRSSDRYDSNTKTFRCTEPIWFTGIDATILAYKHLGYDDYELYLESRIHNHPQAPCSECATTDSCVLKRTKLSVLVCARPGCDPVIISYSEINSIPDSATPLN